MSTIIGNKPLFIYHIPKTAGTSFINYIENNIPFDERVLSINDDQFIIESNRLKTLSKIKLKKIKTIFGHNASGIESIIPEHFKASIFRHPFDRSISHYFFHNSVHSIKQFDLKEVGEYKFYKQIMDTMKSIKGYDGNASYDANFQSQCLAYFLNHNPLELNKNKIKSIFESLSFVIISEYLNLSIFMLHKLYDFPLVPAPYENKGKYFTPNYFVESLNKQSYQDLDLDYYLYSLAIEKFNKQYNDVVVNNEKNYSEWLIFNKKCIEINKS
jgi:hypothetical protein